jgi:hypothetical protein
MGIIPFDSFRNVSIRQQKCYNHYVLQDIFLTFDNVTFITYLSLTVNTFWNLIGKAKGLCIGIKVKSFLVCLHLISTVEPHDILFNKFLEMILTHFISISIHELKLRSRLT